MGSEVRFAIAALEAAAQSGPLTDLPALLGDLERIRAISTVRMSSEAAIAALARNQQRPTRMLTPAETAKRLGVKVSWIYSNWRTKLPFGVKLGPKTLLFPEPELEKFISQRRP